jgi:hypothetical protein
MSTTLNLAEAQKVIKKLQKALQTPPTVFSFSVPLELSQVSRATHKGQFTKKANAKYKKYTHQVDSYLSFTDDLVKVKQHVSKANGTVGLNEILAELSYVHLKTELYDNIVKSTEPSPSWGVLKTPTVAYSKEALNDVYDAAKHEWKTITTAPQFDGTLNDKSVCISLYDESNVVDLYNATLKHQTELENKCVFLNQETKIDVKLSEATKTLCGL